jgi:hypothetical protein
MSSAATGRGLPSGLDRLVYANGGVEARGLILVTFTLLDPLTPQQVAEHSACASVRPGVCHRGRREMGESPAVEQTAAGIAERERLRPLARRFSGLIMGCCIRCI